MPAHIVAATDFSPLSGFGVERAAALAREHQCPLHVLHVYNDFAWENLRVSLRALAGHDGEAAARERLRVLAHDLGRRYSLPAVGSSVVTGRASTVISTCARELGAGLIALGAHGAGIVQELSLGGTAIKVLRASSCPVLVVRREPRIAYETIFVATDFSATAMRAWRAAGDLLSGATYGAVSAYSVAMEGRMRVAGATAEDIERSRQQEREMAQRNMDAFAMQPGFDGASAVRTLVRHGYPAPVLVEESQRLGADLLVVGKHGASVLDERLLGSVTLNVLHHAPCDVLLVP